MTQFWAFLVSIEQYADSEWPIVKGASNDTARTFAYLRDHLQVPEGNIVMLTDQAATRQTIVSKFQEHLVHNDKIQRGDAILFHFSGHGSHTPAPPGWNAVKGFEGEEEAGQPQLEMIIPWDEGTTDVTTGRKICGIPDRTIGALLDRVSAVHGDNITVVLDCCHSGHGTRGSNDAAEEFYAEWTPRGLDSSRVQPIQVDIDAHIMKEANAAKSESEDKQRRRGGFSSVTLTDHVLMAACGPQEQSIGNKKGGLLTTYWLEALLKEDLYPRTYAEILTYVNKQIDVLRAKWPAFITQHPQCEGVTRDRLVFEETIMSPDFFLASRSEESGDRVCRIEAGEAHGIEVGTVFELHEMDNRMQSKRALGSATATKVYATYSLAEYPEGVVLAEARCTAMVLQPVFRLKFSVHAKDPESTITGETMSRIRESLRDSNPGVPQLFTEVSYDQETDLVLEVDDDGAINLRRLDPYLRDLSTQSPRIDAEDVKYADFTGILNAIARFNKNLALQSPQHPFAEEVAFEFHVLEPSPSDDFDDDGEQLLSPQKQIPFSSATSNSSFPEARVQHDEYAKYAFLLTNNGRTPLFPYLVYFDPATYAVETWYTAFEAEKATLLPHKTLQLGSSAEHPGSFGFVLPEGAEIDTSFMKLFLLDTQARMEFVNQGPALGVDENGESVLRRNAHKRMSTAEVETKGRWDTIVRKISVVNGNPDV